MTHPCCPSCRVRFTRSVEEPAPCPICGTATIALEAELVLGFKRHLPEVPEALAVAVALRAPADAPRSST